MVRIVPAKLATSEQQLLAGVFVFVPGVTSVH